MYGEVEGDAPHDDEPELESLHLPGDGPTAPRGCPVLTKKRDERSHNIIMFYNGEVFKL